ncbi:MAG: membrane protein insertase YidC, partial [Pseudomonadota bacterium]
LERPLVLTWDNGEGLIFKRTYTLDENYMFTVNQSVENNTGSPVQLFPFGRIIRHGQPDTLGFFILHEGLVGVFNETLSEIDYDDLIDDGPQKFSSAGGWLGFADKYWLVTLIPGQEDQVDATFRHYLRGGTDRFQVDYLSRSDTGITIPAGGRGESESHLFAGAKEVKVLQAYEEQLRIPRFEFAIDWGWLHFITRPFFWALDQINNVVGNFGIAILVLTVIIKLVFFPLANTSYKSMSRMKLLAPEMTKIRERFKDDRVAQQQEMMALYKREKVNPVSGCLPIIIQIPVFFALYKVLFVTIEMRHAPFFGWIQDLSAPDPTTMFNLFGLIPWDPPSLLMIGIWPLLMGFTMWFQQKLNPAPPDPIQAKVFMFLPIIFTFMLASFPAGLVIYWTWNNALSILQQWVIMKRMGVKV